MRVAPAIASNEAREKEYMGTLYSVQECSRTSLYPKRAAVRIVDTRPSGSREERSGFPVRAPDGAVDAGRVQRSAAASVTRVCLLTFRLVRTREFVLRRSNPAHHERHSFGIPLHGIVGPEQVHQALVLIRSAVSKRLRNLVNGRT